MFSNAWKPISVDQAWNVYELKFPFSWKPFIGLMLIQLYKKVSVNPSHKEKSVSIFREWKKIVYFVDMSLFEKTFQKTYCVIVSSELYGFRIILLRLWIVLIMGKEEFIFSSQNRGWVLSFVSYMNIV